MMCKSSGKLNIAVIGGGPAGLMAALTAAGNGCNVTLFEKNSSCGKKLLLTGSGACNITNTLPYDKFIEGYYENYRFLYPALKTFTRENLLDFFKKKGIKFHSPDGFKIFPLDSGSKSILEALLNCCSENGVLVKYSHNVIDIIASEIPGKSSGYIIITNKDKYSFEKVIIATGGLSYPDSGSTGDGYRFAEKFFHKVIPPRPALCGIKIKKQPDNPDLSGVTLHNVKSSLYGNINKHIKSFRGDILFTHTGVSGPCPFFLSRYIPDDIKDGYSQNERTSYHLKIDLLPDIKSDELDKLIISLCSKNPRKKITNIFTDINEIPISVIKFVLAQADIKDNMKACELTKSKRISLIGSLKFLKLHIMKTEGYKKAIVTAGGVSIREIDPRSMESKLSKGLFFAGETIDIDGFTGGYNLQCAFSTGYLAGNSVV